MSIYVGNLPYEATEQEVNEVFSDYGAVKRVSIPVDRETGKVRGFGFVEMETESNEPPAIEALDGAEWMGRELRVNKARPRKDNRNRGNDQSNR